MIEMFENLLKLFQHNHDGDLMLRLDGETYTNLTVEEELIFSGNTAGNGPHYHQETSALLALPHHITR